MTHPLLALREQIPPVPIGLSHVVAQDGHIEGTAFFPGGWGVWGTRKGQTLPPLPEAGIMVIGQDFDAAKRFECSKARGYEVAVHDDGTFDASHSRTWANLLDLLEKAGVDPQECYFTNAYTGLRDTDKNTGRFPGARNADYKEACRQFLLAQIKAQRPRLIITLGSWVPPFLAELSNDLERWRRKTTFKQLDEAGEVFDRVEFQSGMKPCTVLSLLHPSLRLPNRRLRKRYVRGEADPEVALLTEALLRSQA